MRMRLDPGVARLRSRSSTADVVARLRGDGWSVRVVDVTGVGSKVALLDAFRAPLAFPGWVGRGWDALDDALRDLSWWPAGERGRALIVAGASRIDDGLEGEWRTLCEVLVTAAEWWQTTGEPLGVLVRGRALG
ncbi:MAG: barstar family protein [Chloroflexi bacterium]|nr:barstar family protein [Chloroflexota bacterium]